MIRRGVLRTPTPPLSAKKYGEIKNIKGKI